MNRSMKSALTAVMVASLSAFGAERWAKGETHMHTTKSDGNAIPEEAARLYHEKGFNFCIFTDHVGDWFFGGWFNPEGKIGQKLSDYISIAGSELSSQVPDRYGRAVEVHINTLGSRYPLIPALSKDIVTELNHNIRMTWDHDAIPHVNHPNFLWSYDYRELGQVDVPYLLELVNACTTSYNFGDLSRPSMEQNWDILLSEGRRVFGTCADDAHYYYNYTPAESAPGYGWVVCQVGELQREEVLSALRLGRFYASTGPELESYSVDGRTIQVKVKAQDKQHFRIKFIGRYGRILHEVEGLEAAYTIQGDEGYVRVRVGDDAAQSNGYDGVTGQILWCQPVFVEDIVKRENFAPQAAAFAARAPQAVKAFKFGSAAPAGFTAVGTENIYTPEAGFGWSYPAALWEIPVLLPELAPVQQGAVGGEFSAAFRMKLAPGQYRATLLTGESGDRSYEPATLRVAVDGQTVLAGIPVKSGDYRLSAFDFTATEMPVELEFTPDPLWERGLYHRPWSVTALLIEKIPATESLSAPVAFVPEFPEEPAVAVARMPLAPGEEVDVRLAWCNRGNTPVSGRFELAVAPEMTDYFAIEALAADFTDIAPGAEAVGNFRVTHRKIFDLKRSLTTSVSGNESVPMPTEGVFSGRVVTGAVTGERHFRIGVTVPEARWERLADNRFRVTLGQPATRCVAWDWELAVPAGWTTPAARQGRVEPTAEAVLEFEFQPEAQPEVGEYPAQLTFRHGEAVIPVTLPVRQNGVLGYWLFDEASDATVAHDHSPARRDITLPAGARITAGKHGNAVSFSEVGSGLTAAIDTGLTDGLTAAVWVKLDRMVANNIILGLRKEGTQEVLLFCEEDGRLSGRIYDTRRHPRNRVVFEGAKLETGKWYHLALTWDKNGGMLYIDGEAALPAVGDHGEVEIPDNRGGLFLGGGAYSGGVVGSLDEFYLANYPLPQEEVRKLMRGEQH